MLCEEECKLLLKMIGINKVKKVNFTLDRPWRYRERGYRFSSSLSLTSVLDTVVVNAKLRSSYPREGNPYTLCRKLGGPQGLFGLVRCNTGIIHTEKRQKLQHF